MSDYRDANGGSGRSSNILRVYRRAGQPCQQCGTSIERIVGSTGHIFAPLSGIKKVCSRHKTCCRPLLVFSDIKQEYTGQGKNAALKSG